MTTMQLESVLANPFVQHYADCIENLPKSLQALLTELRNVDAKVTEFHRKLAKMKENLISREKGEQLNADQLNMLHKLLLKCQELGDQKVELVTQIVNLLDAKAKQLVLDKKTIENKNFQPDFDEEKIIADFKAAIKARPVLLTHNNREKQQTAASTGYNLVTKAMSKYIASNYDDNKSQYTRLKEREKERERDLRQKCLVNNFSNGMTKQSSVAFNMSMSNNGGGANGYQLPDRRVKKPRLDPGSADGHASANYSPAKTPHFSHSNHHSSSSKSNNKFSEQVSSLNRSKRQLAFVGSSSKTPLGKKKTQAHHSNRSSLNQHHSSPSSASSSSHSSSHSHRNKFAAKHTTTKSRQQVNSNENRAPNEADNMSRDENHSSFGQKNGSENCAASVISTISSSCASTASSSTVSASSSSTTNSSNVNNAGGDIAEETYCTCRQVSYGSMIACDNDNCKYQWFHFDCVKITTKPKGKWYCPLCRGDSHKVMRKAMH